MNVKAAGGPDILAQVQQEVETAEKLLTVDADARAQVHATLALVGIIRGALVQQGR